MFSVRAFPVHLLLCSSFFLLSTQAAFGDIIFIVDADPDAPGIQTDRQVGLNTQFRVNLLLELTGGSLDAYSSSVRFNTTGLTLINDPQISRSIPLPGYSRQGGALTLNTDVVGRFEAASINFGVGLEGQQGPFVIGQLAFETKSTLGTFNITPFQSANDGSFDFTFAQINSILRPASITAVPEPSSSILVSTAVVASFSLHYRSRRRKRPTPSSSLTND